MRRRKRSLEEKIKDINNFNIDIKVISYTINPLKVELDTNIILTEIDEIIKLISRINSKSDTTLSNIRRLYEYHPKSIEHETILKELKRIGSSLGGKRCIEKYGSMNMNKPGQKSWNSGKKMKDICPNYKNWNEGLTKDSHESLMKISNGRLGLNNPYFKQSEETKERVRTEHSERMKNKILIGEFTPKISNSYTHFQSIVLNKIFRSSWEALFWYFNQHLEYEKLRIPYRGIDKKDHIYIVDFIDTINKIVYEIKPANKIDYETVKLKEFAILEYCKNHNYKFKYVTESDLRILYKKIQFNDLINFNEYCIRRLKVFS